MTNEIIKILKESGLGDAEIRQFPLPTLLSDRMTDPVNQNILKKVLYESHYHSTTKMPQSFFFKHISTIVNVEAEHE
jgi:hypothetical protein